MRRSPTRRRWRRRSCSVAPAARSRWKTGATCGGTTPSRARAARSTTLPVQAGDPEDLLYLLYTSGTTAKPKGIVHTTGGYLVGTAATHHYIFDIKPDSIYWCATPTSAGSPGTATSSTGRSATGRQA